MSKDNLRKYVNDFFDELVLYDDYYNDHYYKDLLKAGIEVFLIRIMNTMHMKFIRHFS